MNAIMFLAGLMIWVLLAAIPVALLVAEGRRERNHDEAVLAGEFDRPAFEPLDDTAGDLAESVHGDHERETDQSEAE